MHLEEQVPVLQYWGMVREMHESHYYKWSNNIRPLNCYKVQGGRKALYDFPE